jgi:Methyltransferase domain
VDACRACGGSTAAVFTTTILGRYDVTFLKCGACDSLQSEPPYWLGESYSTAIAATDTGAMVRNLIDCAAVYAVVTLCSVRGRLLDSGGGAGVLCRLLRDHGLDAHVADKFADPVFARAFQVPIDACRAGEFALISAMEVLEHFVDPARELAQLFALAPQILVTSTQIYQGEGKDWWYLSSQSGQHVFFYSTKCLKLLAGQCGYSYLEAGSFQIFSAKPLGVMRRVTLRLCLSNIGLGMIRLWLTITLRGHHANQDHAMVAKQLAAQQAERTDE